MKQLARFFTGVLTAAFVMAGVTANTAIAQDKAKEAKAAPTAKATKGAPTQKVILENAKVKVYEVTYKPGDENTGIVSSSYRVVRALTDGTTQWTFADGKKETVEWKAGMVLVVPQSGAYTTKNVGKSAIHLYVAQLK